MMHIRHQILCTVRTRDINCAIGVRGTQVMMSACAEHNSRIKQKLSTHTEHN
jgi:hypothetical protein